MKAANFLLVGVGGQGTLLASNVLAWTGVKAGFDVKKAEVHGMAQRGGSVSSHVRWGAKLYSPLIGQGEADYLIAFEKLEALRYVHMLRPGGTVIVGDLCIPPLSVIAGEQMYPGDCEVQLLLAQIARGVYIIPSGRLAEEAGNARTQNMVIIGALSSFIEDVAAETWLEAIAELVPARFVEVNRRAFLAGRNLCGS